MLPTKALCDPEFPLHHEAGNKTCLLNQISVEVAFNIFDHTLKIVDKGFVWYKFEVRLYQRTSISMKNESIEKLGQL